MAWHQIPEPPEGDIAAATVANVELAVGQLGGVLFAFARACVHRGADLSCGIVSLRAGRPHVVCPSHGWAFAVPSGQHDASAACLRTFAIERRADGVYVEVVAGADY